MQQPPRQDDQHAAVQLRIKSELIEVAPGNAESTSFTVKNLGTQVEQFRCVVTGPEWVLAEPATLTVYPGDEAQFEKIVHAPLRELRDIGGDALFTADNDAPAWASALRRK